MIIYLGSVEQLEEDNQEKLRTAYLKTFDMLDQVKWIFIWEIGDNRLVPKVYNKDFLFVGLTTLGILVNFNWLLRYIKCSNVSTYPWTTWPINVSMLAI